MTCKGAAIPFTLDEPTQTSLSLGIQFGTAHTQCAVFSGDLVAKDEGTSNPGPKGQFKGKRGACGGRPLPVVPDDDERGSAEMGEMID